MAVGSSDLRISLDDISTALLVLLFCSFTPIVMSAPFVRMQRFVCKHCGCARDALVVSALDGEDWLLLGFSCVWRVIESVVRRFFLEKTELRYFHVDDETATGKAECSHKLTGSAPLHARWS